MRGLARAAAFALAFALMRASADDDELEVLPGGRKCFKSKATRCRKDYEQCLLHTGPAMHQPTLCRCQAEYYGVCLREAGCAADYMLECIDMQRKSDCEDMSVCGSSCVGAANDLVPDSAVVLPVNNFGQNFLRFTVCEKTYNKRSFARHSVVKMERCDESTFQECPYWIPPNTYTALAISSNASYLRMEYCVLTDDTYGCVQNPRPREFYGTPIHWPSTIDVNFAESTFCRYDSDCPGSFCDHVQEPPTCSPRVRRHFEEPSEKFYEDPFEDRPTENSRTYENSEVFGRDGRLSDFDL